MSEFKLEQIDLDGGGVRVELDDGQGPAAYMSETTDECVRLGLAGMSGVKLTQGMVERFLPYLQEFAATGHFGRHPIQRAFTDPRIERLAESDPLLASVRRHILQEVAGDDTAPVRALVRLLMAYSETLAETLAQLKSAVPAWSRGLEGTVFERGKEYLGDE